MNEKLLLIAKYDGWEVEKTVSEYGNVFLSKDGAVYELKDLSYLTDLNMLHPVALNVIVDLGKNNENWDCCVNKVDIVQSFSSHPNEKGEYIDLFDSVCEGIELYNRQKSNLNP